MTDPRCAANEIEAAPSEPVWGAGLVAPGGSSGPRSAGDRDAVQESLGKSFEAAPSDTDLRRERETNIDWLTDLGMARTTAAKAVDSLIELGRRTSQPVQEGEASNVPEHSYEAIRTDIISALAADGFAYLEAERLVRQFEMVVRAFEPDRVIHARIRPRTQSEREAFDDGFATGVDSAQPVQVEPPKTENLQIVNGWLVERGAHPLDYPAGAAHGAMPYSDAEPLVNLSEVPGWPVQVEVTDEMVTRAYRAQHIAEWGDDLDPKDIGTASDRAAMRLALSAALGGGDHAE